MPKYSDAPSTIYAIRCKTTKRIYVGSSENVISRAQTHFSELRNHRKIYAAHPKQGSIWWQEDFDKYGIEDFELFMLEENVPYKERFKTEQKYIDKYSSDKIGYNFARARYRREDELPFGVVHGPIPED